MSTANAGFTGFAPKVLPGTGNPESLKYGKMWEHAEYRTIAPGEDLVPTFLEVAHPLAGARCIDFGCGTGRAGLKLVQDGSLNVTMLDFTRNCLDSQVRDAIADGYKHRLIFKKADLEQPIPVPPAEYGYCTDVLEHIPPDKVDAVLDNILRSAKHVFLAISCTEDVCGALIGETLHLTLQSPEWWMARLQQHGCMVHWSHVNERGLLVYCTLWEDAQIAVDKGELNISLDEIRANLRVNCAAGWQQVAPFPTQETEVMILGGGPSMRKFEDDIREKRNAGVKLVTLNGAYNWAIEHGITPSATIIVDAREFNKRFTKPVLPECTYFMASQVHPSVLEGLPKERTYLWHTATNDPECDAIIAEAYPLKWPVPGGCTVLLRTIPLLRMLGYYRFHLYGCDSCLEDTAHHAYAQPENDSQLVVPVMVTGGRVFYCHTWMASQAREWITMIQKIGDVFECQIHGDGLLAHIVNTGAALIPAQEGEE